MHIKKAGGKVYGAVLTAAEKKAMDIEIQKELAEYDRKHIAEIDATILWVLHEQFGFGAQRLRTYYDAFHDRSPKKYGMSLRRRVRPSPPHYQFVPVAPRNRPYQRRSF